MAKMRNEDFAEVLFQIAIEMNASIVDGPTALTALKVGNIITDFLDDRESLAELYDEKLNNFFGRRESRIES